MSPCETFAERLAEWLPDGAGGDAAGGDAAPWMAHADDCERCAAALEAERAAEARLRAALHAPVPEGLEALIHRRLAERPSEETSLARPAPRWAGWALAAAAAALFAVGGWWVRGPATPTLEALIVEGQGTILPAEARSAALASGQRIVTTEGRALVRHADALVWLAADSEVVVTALERGDAPALRLVRGGLDFAVAPGPPFVIDTAYGRLRAVDAGGSVRVFGPASATSHDPSREDAMNVKSIALGLGAVAAAAAVVVAVQSGDVEVSNGDGRATVSAGEAGAAAAGEAPKTAARVTALEAQVTELRRERDREKARADRLQARLKMLDPSAKDVAADAPATDAAPRALAEVKADVEALIKEQGMQIMGLDDDHALLKELAAMGPEGVEMLGDLLKTGDANQRFGAAALMEKLLDPAAIPLLEDAILSGDNDGNLLVQRMSSHALAKIGGEKAVPVLERVVAESGEWGVRTNAAFGLAQMGRQSGIDWLRDTFRETDDAMARMMLLGAMAQVGDPSYLPDMHTVLREETEYSRRYVAVTGIAKAAREESLPVLEAIINDPDEDKMIIAEARKAYDEIKGQD